MQPLVLDSTSIFLEVKIKRKCFRASKNRQKGPTTLKVSFFEPPVYVYIVNISYL